VTIVEQDRALLPIAQLVLDAVQRQFSRRQPGQVAAHNRIVKTTVEVRG
jgi:hypothetical protein